MEDLRKEVQEQKLISFRKITANQRALEEVTWDERVQREMLKDSLRVSALYPNAFV